MREAGATAWANVAPGTADQVLVAAIPSSRIEVLAVAINHGDSLASTVTFNSKPAVGAGVAIFFNLKYPPNGGTTVGDAGSAPWFKTLKGESLTVSTTSGSITGIGVIYRVTS